VSLEALQALAGHYRVSTPSMFIRLRNLGLWQAELVLWHQMTNGTFVVKRLWGARMVHCTRACCVVVRLGPGCEAGWHRSITNASGLHIGKYRAEPA
jgi:hypothetical protein